MVQLYVSDKDASVRRPPRELKGFTKINLAVGEEKTVTFKLSYRDFAFYDVGLQRWLAESGDFEIAIGASSW